MINVGGELVVVNIFRGNSSIISEHFSLFFLDVGHLQEFFKARDRKRPAEPLWVLPTPPHPHQQTIPDASDVRSN